MATNERLIVIIERDEDHMMHMWSDVDRGWQEAERVQDEADNLADGTWSAYGVTTAKVCTCCDQIKERYVTALWGCVVESTAQEGRYEPDNLEGITDDYLREVAREVIAEAVSAP